MLTSKQRELLLFIHDRMKESGVPPSFTEMMTALGLHSKSGVHRLVTALEERGFLRRLPNRARAMEVIKLPDAVNASSSVPRSNVANLSQRMEQRDSQRIPVMGRIAAGVPIAAIQQQARVVAVPVEMLGSGEHFALEVRGDSMIEAGIFDGDTVVVRRQDDAQNGDIVVALIDGEEATLKRFRRRNSTIALEAANPAYETRLFGTERVKVQGRMIGLMRQY